MTWRTPSGRRSRSCRRSWRNIHLQVVQTITQHHLQCLISPSFGYAPARLNNLTSPFVEQDCYVSINLSPRIHGLSLTLTLTLPCHIFVSGHSFCGGSFRDAVGSAQHTRLPPHSIHFAFHYPSTNPFTIHPSTLSLSIHQPFHYPSINQPINNSLLFNHHIIQPAQPSLLCI